MPWTKCGAREAAGLRQTSTVTKGSCCWSGTSLMRKRQRRASAGLWLLPDSRKPGCGSCAQQPVSPACGGIRREVEKLVTSWPPSTAGLPKTLGHPRCSTPGNCSTGSHNALASGSSSEACFDRPHSGKSDPVRPCSTEGMSPIIGTKSRLKLTPPAVIRSITLFH